MVRRAKKTDAEEAIRLIRLTFDTFEDELAELLGGERVKSVLEMFFQQEKNWISYENILVKEMDGKVVGVVVCYHGSEADLLDQPFVEYVKNSTGKDLVLKGECREDEFYLETISVDEKYQGKGIGRELMQEFEEVARRRGYKKVGFTVAKDNEQALGFYRKLGYTFDGEIDIYGYQYYRLAKKL